MAAIAASLLVFLVVAAPITVFGVTHEVAWSLGLDYSSWPTKDIVVGDKLVFTYGMIHNVFVVSKDEYDTCNSTAPSFFDVSGNTTYEFEKAGPVYFICATLGHCPGMQLEVNVKASSTGPPTATSPSGSPDPTFVTTSGPAGAPNSGSSSPPARAPSANDGSRSGGLSWLVVGVWLAFGTLASTIC